MKNVFAKALLTSLRNLRIIISSMIPLRDKMEFVLHVGDKITYLTPSYRTGDALKTIFEFTLDDDFEFGHNAYVAISDIGFTSVDLTDVISFPNFDELFAYDGNDLGANYTKTKTTFKLWSPIAEQVKVIIFNNNDKNYYDMTRGDKGVYQLTINDDLLNKEYLYEVIINGNIHLIKDPYGKGVSLNSVHSAVVDTEHIKNIKRVVPTNIIENNVDAIIYETNIRDFTEDKNTNIINKGKFNGFVELNRTTTKGNPAGLSYLINLGITHVQLQPVLDFSHVDDVNHEEQYNWGYDITSLFALEGSYSNKPEIPQERLLEFRHLVDECHKNNIRLILDVVYNHFNDYINSCYENILPGYFFRRQANGQFSNASGCGNDFASEKTMVRKLIVDSIKYLIETFDVDGFRFDLMGLIDIATINECKNVIKKYKPDALIYGEGWDMGYELKKEDKATIYNANKLPDIAFFNDLYRNILRGECGYSESNKRAYLAGNTSYAQGVEYCICGSCLEIVYQPRFDSANQSVNYLECHDNRTLFDKLTFCIDEEEENEILQRVKLGNALLLMSCGITFIHMGQEIGLSKFGDNNSYNKPHINNMNWSLIDQRIDMVMYLKDLIALRKNNSIFKLYNASEIKQHLDFYEDGDLMKITYIEKGDIQDDPLIVIVNPTRTTKQIEFDRDKTILLSQAGLSRNEHLTKRLTIGPTSIYIVK